MTDLDEQLPKDPRFMDKEQFQDAEWGAKQLRPIAIFGHITDEELIELYRIGEIKIIQPKAHAVIEGEPTRGMYMILSGTVSILKKDPATNTLHRLTYLEGGAVFGELSLFDHAPRSATVAAESVCFLFYLDADVFSQFLDDKGDNLKMRFFKKCAEDLVERFRRQNSDYISSQQLLWKYALRRSDDHRNTEEPKPAATESSASGDSEEQEASTTPKMAS